MATNQARENFSQEGPGQEPQTEELPGKPERRTFFEWFLAATFIKAVWDLMRGKGNR